MVLIPKSLRQGVLLVCNAVLCIALALPIVAQIPVLSDSNTASPTPQPERTPDPLRRDTPRGTITSFIRSAHDGDFVAAARYLQLRLRQEPDAATLAQNLNELMDRYYQQPVSVISDSPEGAIDDGLPLDREKVGPLIIGDQEFYIELERVSDSKLGQIWLISSETLDQVPALHSAIERTWAERAMPDVLVRNTIFGLSYAQLVVWAASILIPILLLWFVFQIAVAVARWFIEDPARRRRLDAWYAGIRWPLIFVLALAFHLASLYVPGFPLRFRITYSRIVVVLLIVAIAWLIRRLLTLTFDYMRSKMQRRERASTRSLMLLGERVVKLLVMLVAALLILIIVGVETSTALAGLGIIGVALALGAQKTVENFLGGVFLLTDRALAVGDLCSISNRLGFVEDITLRSVRLRTLEQILLSIPAGVLSQDTIENFSTRGKILMQTTLRLRYGTSAEQLRAILVGIRALIAENLQIESEGSRVRLVEFGIRTIEIELFAYILTADILEFMDVREHVLLEIAEVVEGEGSGFASPEIVDLTVESALANDKQRTRP